MTVTLPDWIAYASERGVTVADEAASEQALVRAKDYIQFRYLNRLPVGYDEDLEVIAPATFIAAALELETPRFFDTTYTPAQQKVLTEVKGIKWTATGDSSSTSAPVSTLIEDMFAPYMSNADESGAGLWSLGGSS